MSDISKLRDTIVPKSDQLNAESLLAGPMTVTLNAVSRGNAEQPLILHYEGDNGQPYKPCKTMRKVLIFAWGDDGHQWVGRSMTLYNDPSVMWGGVKVGGIRISHLSHIDNDINVSITATRGKKTPITIHKLAAATKPAALDIKPYLDTLTLAAQDGEAALTEAASKLSPEIKKKIGKEAYNKLLEQARSAPVTTTEDDD
jgi:hypothetical protein